VASAAIAVVVVGWVLVASHGLRVGALPLALGLLLLAAAAWSAAFAPVADRRASNRRTITKEEGIKPQVDGTERL
jgi:hypothetical protein